MKTRKPQRRLFLECLDDRIAPAAWTPQGPGPTLNGQSENVPGPNAVTGAVHVVAPHPTNANILYVGGVNGGVWRSTNATAANPTWVNLTDTQASQSMGALAFDPTDPTSQTLVAGFGRFSSYGSEGAARAGLIRTTDGGNTWTAINGGVMAGRNISGVAVRGNTIVAAVNFADSYTYGNVGIFRSTNGGASYTQISNGNGGVTGLPGGIAFDLAADPVSNNILYVSVLFAPGVGGVNGVYKSTDTGATWSLVSNAAMNALITDGGTSNVEMAVGTANNVYVGIINSGQIAGLYRSGNGGTSWTAMDIPKTPQGSATPLTNATNAAPIVITSNAHGLSTGNLVVVSGVNGNTAANGTWYVTNVSANTFSLNGSAGNGAYTSGGTWQRVSGLQPRYKPENNDAGGQGAIHFSILADPNNANIVYIGGDRQDTPFPNSIGANNFSGRLFRGDASVTPNPTAVPSPQWTPLTHVGTASNSSPHADSRDMAFDANGNIIQGDDGGLYRRTNPTNSTGDWFAIPGSTLQVGELHNIAYDSRSNVIIAGTQDNASPMQSAANNFTWDTQGSSGDGGDVAIDEITLAGSSQTIRYVSAQNAGGLRRMTYNASNGFVSNTYLTIPGAYVNNFTTPVVLNTVNPQRLILVGGNSSNAVFESFNQGSTWTQLTGPGSYSPSLVYGHATNIEAIWGGTYSGAVYRRLTAGGAITVTPTAFPGGGTAIKDIVLGVNANTAFVLDDNQVYRTTDAGSTWTDITGNILALGAADLRSIEYVPAASGDFLVVGTRRGVYSALVSSPTTWALLGTGLPMVQVYDMEYDATDDVLVVGTFGRGAWKLSDVAADVSALVINANQAGGNGMANGTADNFRLVVNGANLEIYIDGTLSRTVQLSLINTITVVGSSDNDTLNMTGGLINVPGGVTFTASTGTDMLQGPNTASTWSFTGVGTGTLASGPASVSFDALENATGGTATDAFNFNGGSLAGTIDGGTNTDTLTGDNVSRSYSITSANGGSVLINATTTTFVNVENLTGGSSDDNFSIGTSGALAGTIAGGAGNDQLIGNNVGLTFGLTGANAGNITGVLAGFGNVETIVGGTGPDTLVIGAAGSLSGFFNGATGTDTLNTAALAAHNFSVVGVGAIDGFDLGGVTSVAGGVQSTNVLVGTSGNDSVTGLNASASWAITGSNSGSYSSSSRALVFSNLESLNGGTGSDTVTFVGGGSLTGTFNGGAGSDTLVGDTVARIFTINGSNSGSVATILPGGFSSVENLTGGGVNDSFTFINTGALTGTLDGGAGSDTLTGTNANLTYSITGTNAGTVSTILPTGFTNVENLTAGTGTDNFAFSASGSLTGSLAGGANSDTVTGGATGATYAITSTNAGTISTHLPAGFSGIENLTAGSGSDTVQLMNAALTGAVDSGDGNDTFQLTGSTLAATLLGGAGNDVFQVQSGSFSGTFDSGPDDDTFQMLGGVLTSTAQGGTGNDILISDNASRMFNITGPNVGNVAGLVTAFDNIETLQGGAAPDQFIFGAAGSLTGTVDGGAAFDTIIGSNSALAYTITGPNTGAINGVLPSGFTDVENLTGGSNTDSFSFIAPGSLSGSLNGGSGSDTVAGDNSDRIYTLTAANTGTISGLLPMGFTSVENVQGGTANDSIVFGGGTLSGSVQGGAGADTLHGDNLARTYTLTGADAGNVSGLAAFVSVENLLGGTGNDTLIRLTAGTLTGTFNGRAGTDTVDLRNLSVAQTLTLTNATLEGFQAILTGLGGSLGIDRVQAPTTTSDRVNGLALPSTWQVRAGTNQTFYRVTATGATLYLEGLEVYAGSTASDAYKVDFGAGVPIGVSGIMVDGASGTDRLEVIGTAVADTITVAGSTLGINGRAVRFVNLEQLTTRGGNGNDQFKVGTGLPSVLGIIDLFGEGGNDYAQVLPATTTRINFNGGVGTDKLRLDIRQTGLPVVDPPPGVTTGSYTFTLHQPVSFVTTELREFGNVL